MSGHSADDTDRPVFIDPQTEWVECYLCGRVIEDFSRVEGMDISDEDEYYPKMVPVCADGNHRSQQPDTEQSGLYSKYEVRKDGEPVENCFVLEPESDSVAREALWTYAIETDDEELAEDLKTWLLRTVGVAEDGDSDA